MGSASLFSYSSGHTLLERHPSSPRAAGQQPLHGRQAALVASHQALKSAVALCQRHSLEARQDTAHHLWFQLLQVALLLLRCVVCCRTGTSLLAGRQCTPGCSADVQLLMHTHHLACCTSIGWFTPQLGACLHVWFSLLLQLQLCSCRAGFQSAGCVQ